MSKEKRPYISPRVSSYKSTDELPAKLRSAAEELLHVRSSLKVTVDENWRNVSVSEEFPGDLAQYVLVPGSRITMILNAENSRRRCRGGSEEERVPIHHRVPMLIFVLLTAYSIQI